MKPIIFSPYMANIPQAVVDAQREVVERLAAGILFVQAKTVHPHGSTLNILLASAYDAGYDTALLLDIDAIPLSRDAVTQTLAKARTGTLVGNAQRSNHIANGKHVFAAPSFMGISISEWHAKGRPSFSETKRGDVAEEVTYRWEQTGGAVDLYMPMRFDAKPIECEHWALGDGMPVYGCQTTFGRDGVALSYHAFQISHQRNVDAFMAKCKEIVG